MNVLGVIADELTKIGVPYAFMEWTADVQYPYFVGEYSETVTASEDGYKEATLLLTGTTNGTWMELEQIRAKVESHFPRAYGLRMSTDNGCVAIFYANTIPVPTGVADLKRIQINLDVKEWRDNA